MHVVLLCGYYYPDTVGGTEAYVRMLGRDLKEAGHDVTVAAPATGDAPQTYTHDGLDVIRYPVSQNPTRAEVRGDAPPAHLPAWEAWLDDVQPDLVHMHSRTRGCSPHHAAAVTKRDVPLLVTVHVPGSTCPRGTLMRWGDTPCDGEIRPVRCSACLLQQAGFPRSLAWAVGAVSSTGIGQVAPSRLGTVLDRGRSIRRWKGRTRRWLRSADQVVVVAQWLEEVLVRNGVPPERVTISRHGLSDDVRSMQEAAAAQRSPRDPDRPLRIGFVGRFTEVKGVHVLVDAVRRLPESVDVTVHLYGITQSDGDEQYLATLKERARDEARIRFCGPMTDDNRVEAFAGFDVLAVPSISKETGPYTVLEAFAAGIPVLGSNHSGIRERVTDGESGRLVASGDPDAWTRALQDLYDRHRSGDWSWTLPAPRTSKDVAREMNALYRRVR